MAHYSGITSDPSRRRQEHLRDKKNLRNWTAANGGVPFATRKEAQSWEDRQPGEHHPGGAPAQGPWYGCAFDYDNREGHRW